MAIGTDADWSTGTPQSSAAGFFGSLLRNFVPNAAQAGLTYAAGKKGIDDLRNYGRELRTGAEADANRIMSQGTFKPFTVTTGLSTTNVGADGGYNIALNPQQQFYQDELFGTAAGMLQGATQDQGTREQQVFNRLQAMLNPVQERERLELENRLQGQGRLGVRTSMYGGTPEQLALAKAQAEAQNMAGFQAMQEARAQQAQGAQIGTNLFQLGYLPTQQAMASLTPATNFADISGAAQRQALQASTALRQAGLESDVGARVAASGAEQNMFDTLLNISGNALGVNAGQQSQAGLISSLIEALRGK
jgi:hypothetical protein